jgi:hypothetical protein
MAYIPSAAQEQRIIDTEISIGECLLTIANFDKLVNVSKDRRQGHGRRSTDREPGSVPSETSVSTAI